MPYENSPKANRLEREVFAIKRLQIPTNLVAAEFGEVNVRRNSAELNSEDSECYVEFTIAMEPQGRFAEGWRTGLAMDASASMKRAYGRKVAARVDPRLLTDYIKQGRLRSYLEDGEPTRKIQREAFAEIQEKGYEVNYTENILQPLVQDFTTYLAGSLDGTGKTSLIYWGCGKGDEIQSLGEFDVASCQELAIAGPKNFQIGKTTKLCPAIAYFADKYHHAQQGLYIFVTDGRIDDLEEAKIYTKELALEIAVGKRNYLKLILIGIGNDVDRYQLQELDDFDTGLDIDLWDYKIADEMTNLTQIFAEVVNENQIIAENGSIYDDAGQCVKSYPKGLPAKVDFVMRHDSQWFELEVSNQRIRQSVVFENSVAIAPFAQKKLFDFEIEATERQNVDALAEQELDRESDRELHGDVEQVRANNLNPIRLNPIRLNPIRLNPIRNYGWKWLAAILIGAAFMGTAIAFAILIKRSDDNQLQNQATPSPSKESEIKPQVASSNKSGTNLLANSANSSKPSSNTSANSLNAKDSSKNNSGNKSNNNSEGIASKPLNSISGENSNKSANISANKTQIEASNNFTKVVVELAKNNSINNFLKATSDSSAKSASSIAKSNASKSPNDSSVKMSGNNPEKIVANNSSNIATTDTNSSSIKTTPNQSKPRDIATKADRNISTSILPIANPDSEITIFFPSDESQVMVSEEKKLDTFWAKIQGKQGIIQVSGHTDTTGDYAYNLDLSQSRANEVLRLLRDRGLDNNYKITFEALSWLHPLRKNSTATDNAFNRRVVIQFKEQR